MASVFLSYDRDHASVARSIATALERAGHSVWWDRRIGGGTEYAHEIEQALESADVVVVIWTSSSVGSPWVRDEAGAGRDRGRLVPLSLEGTQPPIGFRQFQSIDLGSWKGRGRVPRLPEILAAIDRQSKAPGIPVPAQTDSAKRRWAGPSLNIWAVIAVVITMFFVVVGLLIGRPWERKSSAAPTVSVSAADTSSLSQEMARNLLTKLGSLQTDPARGIRTIEASEGPADIQFRVNASRQEDRLRANVALVSGRGSTIAWSKDFERPVAARSDFEEEIASSASRVLACARDEASGEFGRLSEDLRRTYLGACAGLTEAYGDAESLVPQLRHVTEKAPTFRPGWARLIAAEIDYVSSLPPEGEEVHGASATLRKDIVAASKVDPDMAEATLAELEIGRNLTPVQTMALVDKAKAQDPQNPIVLVSRAVELGRVGRMFDGLAEAETAAKLAPLSPTTRTNLIFALLFAGAVDRARLELASAKRIWPDSPAVGEAEYELGIRASDNFEDFARKWGRIGPGFQIYSNARRHPDEATIRPYMAFMSRAENKPRMGFALQGLGEINRPNEFYRLIAQGGVDAVARDRSLLFRPWMASIRRDPRFIPLAGQLGLVDYWKKSGRWPDFCADAELKYDCKTEAAKLK